MDLKVTVYHEAASIEPEDAFLLREGLELLAAYRAIGNETLRQAVRHLVVSLAAANDGVSN